MDVLWVHRQVLSLAALCWAAAGKDPGLTPLSLLELLTRRGRYRPEDFARLHLAEPVDLAPPPGGVWLSVFLPAGAGVRRA